MKPMTEEQATPPALPDAALELLLLAQPAEDPPAGLQARVLARLQGRIDAAGSDSAKQLADVPHASAAVAGQVTAAADPFVNIAFDDGWQPLAPHAQMKVLFDDGHTLSWLVRMEPGCVLDPHAHVHGPEECLVVSGSLWLDDAHMVAGDYQLARPGSGHAHTRSDEGCVLFVRSPSPQRIAAQAAG